MIFFSLWCAFKGDNIFLFGQVSWLVKNVPMGSASRGGDLGMYFFDINQPRLPIVFYSVLMSVFLFVWLVFFFFSILIALSTVFHSIKTSDNSPLSHSVLPVLFLPYWSFQMYISL